MRRIVGERCGQHRSASLGSPSSAARRRRAVGARRSGAARRRDCRRRSWRSGSGAPPRARPGRARRRRGRCVRVCRPASLSASASPFGVTNSSRCRRSLRAFLLHHIALVDQLLEHAAERLLGDVEDLEQVGDLHAGIAVDEMQHPVMGAAEAELGQHLVRVADEIAIGEKQQLDDVPDRLGRAPRVARALGQALAAAAILALTFMSAMLTYFGFMLQKRAEDERIVPKRPFLPAVRRRRRDRSGPDPFIPGVAARRKVLE